MGSLVAELAEKLSSATNSIDFDEQTLFLNTSANTVGVGTNAPASKFDVRGTMQVGIDDTGYDVQFFGDAAGALMLWDTSEDSLYIRGATADHATTSAGRIVLQTNQAAVADGDRIGQIDFQASNETGADALLVSASIWAEADDTFDATGNETELVFATGASELAAERVRITSDGKVGIGTDAPARDLSVYGAGSGIEIKDSGTGIGYLSFADAGDNSGGWKYDHNTDRLYSSEGGYDRGLSLKSGNVGIASAAPAYGLDVAGTVGITGATTHIGALTVGVSGTGHDVIFYGDTAGRDLKWDQSEDLLTFTDDAGIVFGTGNDMKLYHDGNSYITNAVGVLKIATETSGIAVRIGHSASEVTVADNLTVTGNQNMGTATAGSIGSGVTGFTGIKNASTWRLTADFEMGSSTSVIASNLEQVDTDSGGIIGSAMTQSSGVFTFPATGHWFILAQATWEYSTAKDQAMNISVSDDSGSAWSDASRGTETYPDVTSGSGWSQMCIFFLMDMDNTSTRKVRFTADPYGSNQRIYGDSNFNETAFTFIRLGDT